MSIEAMKQALEALEEINKLSIGKGAICLPAEIDTAMDALRQAIEQAEKQEPFGYLEIEDIESHSEYPHNCRSVNLWYEGGEGMVAIYTTPQPQREWVGLTEEEMQQACYEAFSYDPYVIARAIEAKLKEKNT